MRKIKPDHYIQIDDDFMTVLYYENGGKQDRFKVDALAYLLNELSMAISNNKDITQYSVILSQREANFIITEDVVNKKSRKIRKKLDVLKDVIFHDLDTTVSIKRKDYDKKIFIFSYFYYEHGKDYIEVTFNSEFIEYFKRCRNATEGYFKLYLDIMVSLPTVNSKILFALLSKYDDQMHKYEKTNRTSINMLKFYLDDNKKLDKQVPKDWKEYDKYVYSMINTHLVTNVENSLKAINTLISTKNKLNSLNLPGYKVNWIREFAQESDTRQGQLHSFTFSHIDLEPLELEKPQTPVKNKPKDKPKYTDEIKEIIDYLNEKANKHFKYDSVETVRLINARLNDKYTIEEFKYVIDVKVAEWKNDKEMNQYLRPSTLFNATKFENYLNSTPVTNKTDHHHNNKNGWEQYGF